MLPRQGEIGENTPFTRKCTLEPLRTLERVMIVGQGGGGVKQYPHLCDVINEWSLITEGYSPLINFTNFSRTDFLAPFKNSFQYSSSPRLKALAAGPDGPDSTTTPGTGLFSGLRNSSTRLSRDFPSFSGFLSSSMSDVDSSTFSGN